MSRDDSLLLNFEAQIGLSIRGNYFWSCDIAFSTLTCLLWHHASNDVTAAVVKSFVACKTQHNSIFRQRENVKKHIVKNRAGEWAVIWSAMAWVSRNIRAFSHVNMPHIDFIAQLTVQTEAWHLSWAGVSECMWHSYLPAHQYKSHPSLLKYQTSTKLHLYAFLHKITNSNVS